MDEEGPRRAFTELAQQVNDLAAKAAAAKNPNAPPPPSKTADEVSILSENINSDTGGVFFLLVSNFCLFMSF